AGEAPPTARQTQRAERRARMASAELAMSNPRRTQMIAAQYPETHPAVMPRPQERRGERGERGGGEGREEEGEGMTALIETLRARIAASERLKAIARQLGNQQPVRRLATASEGRRVVEEMVRTELSRIVNPLERQEAEAMFERIITPGRLQHVRQLYSMLPVWEENAPPPEGWPFRLPGQRAAMQRESMESAATTVSREREYRRDYRQRNRNREAASAARDLFDELIVEGYVPGIVSGSGAVPRLPRAHYDLLPSYEMMQLRDLPTMLTMQNARVPVAYRMEDSEEQVVPTGPSMRSVHTVPTMNSQAELRERYEHEYRARVSEIMTEATDRHRRWVDSRADDRARSAMDRGEEPESVDFRMRTPNRPTDTPHPGSVGMNGNLQFVPPSMSPLARPSPPPVVFPLPRVVGPLRGGEREERARQHAEIVERMAQHAAAHEEAVRRYGRRPPTPTDVPMADARDDDDRRVPSATTAAPTGFEPGPSNVPQARVPIPSGVPAGWMPTMNAAAPPTQPVQHEQQLQQQPKEESKIRVFKLRKNGRDPGMRKESSPIVGIRRLLLEKQLMDENGGVEGVDASPSPDNVRTWTAVAEGVKGSQFEGGIFFFDITFPQSYPMGRIKIACLTHIVHPHVMRSGMVDVDAVAKLCFGKEKFADLPYGGVEKSLKIVAAIVSGKLPGTASEQSKLIERGKIFTARYAC
ncbi:hypothetical protein PFISCL1PPCAC_20605, partial [Pristionchus fissidentatus]